MSIEKLRPSFTFTEERLRELQQVVPEAFVDGKINWDTLREALGEHLEDEEQEHFGLTWPGKREARRLATKPCEGTLVSIPGEGVNEDTTRNIYIEGENLEVLKLLQKSYAGRIKVIYIDPPYNTGNDLIYVDDFAEPLDVYYQRLQLTNNEGIQLSTNIRADGRFHTKWINIMYPRLLLAHKLLRDDGVIFVSIDDNELCNLKTIMDEIFGEENFINIVTVKAKPSAGASGGGEDKRLKKNVEFLLIYSRNRETEDILRFRDVFEEEDLFEHIRTMKIEGKSWKYTRVLTKQGNQEYIKSIQDGSGNEIRVYRQNDFELVSISDLIQKEIEKTKCCYEQAEETIYKEHFTSIIRDTNAQSSIRSRIIKTLGDQEGLFSIEYIPKSGRNKGKTTKVFYKGAKKDQIAWLSDIAYEKNGKIILKGNISTLWDDFNWNNVSKEGNITFPNGKKPIMFIERMLELTTIGENEEIVLDFFGGSGSTAHAVFDLNIKDGGDRKFILIQIPEKAKGNIEFTNISELCKQRIRNSISGYEPIYQDKIGYVSYKIEHSQFKRWPANKSNIDEVSTLFDQFETPLILNWQLQTLLIEIILNQGFPLDSNIQVISSFKENTLRLISDEFCAHKLYICLDEKIADKTEEALSIRSEDIFVCLDTALTDEVKLRLSDRCQLKVI